MEQWFVGKTAVVTGAAHGIGRATAELLDQLGAKVIAVDLDDVELAKAFDGSTVIPWRADICGDVAKLAQEISEKHGLVELLVNNVGITTSQNFLEASEEDFDLVFNTNLRGPWFLTRAIVQGMIAAESKGAVVFISSLHDSYIIGSPPYSTSKAAVTMLVKELTQELGPHGIRVNAVSPGLIHTHDAAPPETIEGYHDLIPLGDFGDASHVARMAAVLLSEEWSGFVTGANVRVDGGLGVHSWMPR